jgi:Uncharacterized protein conserved in bacteria (DUF2252)
MVGNDETDPLFLQLKEAEASVFEPFLGMSEFAQHGQRVVEGPRLMQSASDILLGWHRSDGLDGVTRDYFVRQLWDGKGSALADGSPTAHRVRRDVRVDTGPGARPLRRRRSPSPATSATATASTSPSRVSPSRTSTRTGATTPPSKPLSRTVASPPRTGCRPPMGIQSEATSSTPGRRVAPTWPRCCL